MLTKDQKVICEWIRADNPDKEDEYAALPDDLLLTLHPEYVVYGPKVRVYDDVTAALRNVKDSDSTVVEAFKSFLGQVPTVLLNEYVVTSSLKTEKAASVKYALRGETIDSLTSILEELKNTHVEPFEDLFKNARAEDYARIIYCAVIDESMGAALFTFKEKGAILSGYNQLCKQQA